MSMPERLVPQMSEFAFSNQVAKERLKLMIEAEPIECTPELMARMKREVSDIIGRYFELSPDAYEIKVILKQNRK